MRRIAALLLTGTLAVVMMAGMLELPAPGTPDAPAHTRVSSGYITGGAEAAGAENLVTGVLLNYRALDTFGEVVVIFTALLAVLAVARPAGDTGNELERSDLAGAIPVSPVVSHVVRLMAPFIAAFAFFVMLTGHVLPGGGFQGGVVLGAMLVLLVVVRGRGPVAGLVPATAVSWLRAAGPLTFGAFALFGGASSGWIFGMPDDPVLRGAWITTLELGIGIGGAAVMTGLFLSLEAG